MKSRGHMSGYRHSVLSNATFLSRVITLTIIHYYKARHIQRNP